MVLMMASLAAAQLIPMDYCSTINTGSGPGNHSDFQSDGLCQKFCKDSNHGLAIVQSSLCWCSNVVPGNGIQLGIDKCKSPCPGFPDDFCGGDGTYGYMRIRANAVTSTASAGSGSTNTQQQQQTRPPTQVSTVTADGTTRIVTVVPTGSSGSLQPGNSESNSNQNGDGGGGLATGAAVGIAVGVIAIFVAGGVIGFIFLRRKRRQDREAQEASMSENHGGGMSQPSTGFATRRPTNGTWGSEHSSGRRSSMPDPRMKSTNGVYSGALINRSHESFESMQDNFDYSRPVHHPGKVLRVANPTPGEHD